MSRYSFLRRLPAGKQTEKIRFDSAAVSMPEKNGLIPFEIARKSKTSRLLL